MRRLAVLLLLAAAVQPAAAQPAPPPGLDAAVARILDTFSVPGASVAIVKDGQTVLAAGYGTRQLGQDAPVDAETRFGIASNSKAFTATALGMLVEDGKLEWDMPVARVLPAFSLIDPVVTHELTVRDLLVHRSGLSLGAGDLLWWPASTETRAETVARLRYLPLSTSFRSQYAYDNVLYMVAGEVVEAASRHDVGGLCADAHPGPPRNVATRARASARACAATPPQATLKATSRARSRPSTAGRSRSPCSTARTPTPRRASRPRRPTWRAG